MGTDTRGGELTAEREQGLSMRVTTRQVKAEDSPLLPAEPMKTRTTSVVRRLLRDSSFIHVNLQGLGGRGSVIFTLVNEFHN